MTKASDMSYTIPDEKVNVKHCFPGGGGAVPLVCYTTDPVVLVQALAGRSLICSKARRSTPRYLFPSSSINEWVVANC